MRIFVGYDAREVLPFHVLSESIFCRSSRPVSITPVKLSHLPLTRPVEGSTEFSLSRFLTPWMCGFEGIALFMDCDMLVQCDIAELFAMKDGTAVQVVQHDYTPRDTVKFYGNVQKSYPKKNWSSVMLFDCAQCAMLTPDYVDSAPASDLHQLAWASSVGELPIQYNHLVGEYAFRPDAKIIHWTVGGPWLRTYRQTDYAGHFRRAMTDMTYFKDG